MDTLAAQNLSKIFKLNPRSATMFANCLSEKEFASWEEAAIAYQSLF